MTASEERPATGDPGAGDRATGDDVEAFGRHLRAQGRRLGHARRRVLEGFAGLDRPVTAEELAARVPDVHVSSVYRSLVVLEELGLVAHVHLAHGPALYELAPAANMVHLVCEVCGRDVPVPPDVFDPVRDAHRHHLRVPPHRAPLRGRRPVHGVCRHGARTPPRRLTHTCRARSRVGVEATQCAEEADVASSEVARCCEQLAATARVWRCHAHPRWVHRHADLRRCRGPRGRRPGRVREAGGEGSRRQAGSDGGPGVGVHLRRPDAQLPGRVAARAATCSAGCWPPCSSGRGSARSVWPSCCLSSACCSPTGG